MITSIDLSVYVRVCLW